MKDEEEQNESMKWSWFKVPVKVEQINEYLFSDTLQSQKQKVAVLLSVFLTLQSVCSDEVSHGQYQGYPSKCIV